MAVLLRLICLVLLVNTLPSTGQKADVTQSTLQKIASRWKSKSEWNYSLPVSPVAKMGPEGRQDTQTVLQKVLVGLETFRIMNERKSSSPNIQENEDHQNHLSEFLYNISTLLQTPESLEQNGDSWEELLEQFFPSSAETPPPTPTLRLKDFLVSLRGSQNWDSLLSFFQSILRLFNKDQTVVTFLRDNWDLLTGLADTIFQAFLSGTLGQASAPIKEVLCSLLGRTNCQFNTDWLQQLLTLFERTSWKPVVHVQSGSSSLAPERLTPFTLLPGVLREKHLNQTSLTSGRTSEEMSNLAEILYRSTDRDRGVQAMGSSVGPEDPLWEGLDEFRESLLRRMGRSVDGNLNRRISRMTDSLINRISSVIGVPQSEQDGTCYAGNVQQLLLWGLKHNINWDAAALGFRSGSLPSAPPILSCGKSPGILQGKKMRSFNVNKSSNGNVLEESWKVSEVLEAVCNESIPGLPGISNFTIYLYCNLFNSTEYIHQPATDLRASCSDAAWYFSSVEGDSLWVKACSEFFPVAFNVTVCKNSSLSENHSHNQLLIEELCANLSVNSDDTIIAKNNSDCPETLNDGPLMKATVWNCRLENKTRWLDILCNNATLQTVSEESRLWISKICPNHRNPLNALNSSVLRNVGYCNFKTWNPRTFGNATLMEQCRGLNANAFKDLVCGNSTLYEALIPFHPWIVDHCSGFVEDSFTDEKCFLQKFEAMIPVFANVDSSELCRNPVGYFIELVTLLSECDDETSSWIMNVNYLLRLLDVVLTVSNLGDVGDEVRDQLAEAILLSSLLDNSSFWAAFQRNSSLSILQTVGWYLEQEHNASFKKDLLNCFSPLLWDLIQNEENATALEVLFQEYLHMRPQSFQRLLMSAENDAVKRFVAAMHRGWHRVQVVTGNPGVLGADPKGVQFSLTLSGSVTLFIMDSEEETGGATGGSDSWVTQSDERALEGLTSSLIQKFPHLTPQLFVDLSQFIPFMSITDILALSPLLLANESVLAAIRSQSMEMKLTQKRAFAKRLLMVNIFGDISSWPSYFLRSILPLLPYLPLCHFLQLTPEQITSLSDGWDDVRLGLVQGRYVVRSLMNGSTDVTGETVDRLGVLVCFLGYEELRSLFPLYNPFSALGKKLLRCLADATLSSRGRLAHALAESLRSVNVSALDGEDFHTWGGIFSELGVQFVQRLPDRHLRRVIPQLQAADVTPAQAHMMLKRIGPLENATGLSLCSLQSLFPGLRPETLRSLSASVMANICQCLHPVMSLLSSAQKAAILQSVRGLIYEQGEWPMRLDCLLPFAPLKLLQLNANTILGNISQYGPVPWTPQQTQFLWEQVQGSMNLSKDSILELGTIAGGMDCKTLRELNSPSDFMEVAKHIYGLPRGLRRSMRKCILDEIQKRPGLSSKDLGWIGPDFIMDLPMKLINELSGESVKLLLEHVNRQPTSFLRAPSHKQFALARTALRVLRQTTPPDAEIGGEVLDLLGPLVGFLDEDGVSRISRQSLLLRLDELKVSCLSEGFAEQLGRLLVEESMLGNPAHWTRRDVEMVGTLLFSLSQETLYTLPKEVLSRDLLEWLLESQRRWEASEVGQLCRVHTATFQGRMRAKKMILVSSIVKDGSRKHRELVPSCGDMKMTFPSAWSAGQIAKMPLPDFENCLNLISQDTGLSAEQAKASLAKSKQLFGTVRSMHPVHVLQLGHLSCQLSEKDLQEIGLTDWGIVSFLGNMDGWTLKQMRVVVMSILRQNRKAIPDLDLPELAALGHFLCGFRAQEIGKINSEEFSMAAVFVGTRRLKCTEQQMEALAGLLIFPSAFGPVSSWGADIFTEIGSLAAGLQDIVMSSLVREQIQGLTVDAITLIPAMKLAVIFTPAQLAMFTSEQAAAVMPEQYDLLSPEQRQAVTSAQYEGEISHDHRGENSAASVILGTFSVGHLTALLCLVFCTT